MVTGDKKDELVLASFATLSILQLIKDAQQKHGLRHGDHQRYRGYCARRVKRIRKSLGFSHVHKSVPKHPAKFVQKKLTFEVVTEERFLHIVIFDAERNWSYAMQLKQEAGEEPHSRKRFRMLVRLRKAVKHTSTLEAIVRASDRTDAATKLEAQAYNAWMCGCLSFEEKEWKGALDNFKTAKTIYEKLGGVVKSPELVDLYRARSREIQPQMRYCEFNSGDEASTDAAMSEIISMRLKLGGDEGALQDDFDKLIAEMRTKATMDHEREIYWAGERVAVKSDAVKLLLEALDHFEAQLEQTSVHDDKIALYEQLLGHTRDAIQCVTDEQKKALSMSIRGEDAATFKIILAFLDFVRLSKTIDRYILIIHNTCALSEKKVKPQDLLRLYDSVIENSKELLEIPGAMSDTKVRNAYEAKMKYYRAFRCYYMAEAYASLSKYQEASALYERAVERTMEGEKAVGAVEGNSLLHETKDEMKELMKQIVSAKYNTQASRLAEAAGDSKVADDGPTDTRPLIDTLDEYRKVRVDDVLKPESGLCVVPMPPSFIPMPNKPIFFDLALNHIQMPDLETKIASFGVEKKSPAKQAEGKGAKGAKGAQAPVEEEQHGISGLVKGWFWGKK